MSVREFVENPPYVPGPGDVLDVRVHATGERHESFSAAVSPAGTIRCPVIGEFALAGQPLHSVANRMSEAFRAGYYLRPQVLIRVLHYSGRVSLTGEVRHPGLYPLNGGLTLVSAIELAGGLTHFAASRNVRVVRNMSGTPRRIEADLGRLRRGRTPDIPLHRGDRVEVPRRWF